MVRFGVLGPLVAEDEHGPVDVKGPRHRAVLARLLVARGRVVPVDRLVDDLWETPPDGAVGALQTFVSALRRAIEPDRPPRAPATVLVTASPGYALRTDDVDALRFEADVAASGDLLARHRAEDALSRVDTALALWRGPAYAGFDDQPWARAEITRLTELRLLATERRAAALLAVGRAREAVPDLEAHVGDHPWREDGWRMLALAMYRAGRQGDALAALRRARQVLADELGVDPGPGLRQVEADILAHAPHLTEQAATTLVGRAEELAALTSTTHGLVLISGDAGSGKTALAEAFAAARTARGWTTAWGDNPEDGTPAAWPWHQVLDALGAGDVPASTAEDPVVARFHWHRAVSAHLGAVARQAPLLLVFDDLHWAGAETVALLASVVADAIPRLLVVATYRTTDVSPELTDFLGRVARAEPVRLYLGGLAADAVPDLVRATIGRDVDAATSAAIHLRSGGNPFFVRELARLFDADGDLAAVPPGVRDVVRHRVAALPASVHAVLRRAAVLGDVDLEVLGADVLAEVEAATERGFLVERGPRRFRFAHDLVRDTLYQDISRSRRAQLHAEIAVAIERLRPDDVDALAHHFVLAEHPSAVRYATAAARRAERRHAHHEAARLWQAALTAHRGAVRERLDLVMGLVRALAVTGALDRARRHRAEALDLAETLADPVITAEVIGAFDVPAIWTDNDDPALAARIAALAERTIAALPPTRLADRARLLATLAVELRTTGGERARTAAHEAEAIARELADPALLAFALNARFLQSFDRAGGAPARVRIGAELVELATRHTLVTFEVLGHLILVQAHAALADLTAADRHAEAADRLGADYQIPLVSVFTEWYRALRASITGEATEARYRAAAARLAGTGMSGLDNGILPLALLCGRVRDGLDVADADYGAYEPWCRPFVTGRAAAVPDSPRDLLYEARTCLHAVLAIRFDDRAAMRQLYDDLLPAAGELAGAGSGLLTLGPVTRYLGDLAAALGDHELAAEHRAAALRVR
jgi:DNA-binding SARP family transcriptional activator